MKYHVRTAALILGAYGAISWACDGRPDTSRKLEKSETFVYAHALENFENSFKNEMHAKFRELNARIDDLERRRFTERITGFEQDPAEFAVLGVPEGSYTEGARKKGGRYKVTTHVRGEEFDFIQPVLKGNADMIIRLRVGRGNFYGMPGEPIKVWLTGEEMETLKSGGEVPYQVSALSPISDPGGSPHPFWEIEGSFSNGRFVMEKDKSSGTDSVGL